MKNTALKIFSFSNIPAVVSILLFTALTVWWSLLGPFSPSTDTQHARDIWGGTYQIMAYWGGIIGLIISASWGGRRSVMGKSILAFSIGLLLQGFGQSVYTFYLFHAHIQAPYPSLGDVGFFGTIIMYFIGAYYLTKLSGVKSKFEFVGNKLLLILIPFVVLVIQYFLILRDYEFDWGNKIKIFLDLGYPLGDAMVVSIAIFAFLLSRNFFGGLMKKPILFIVFALFIQYFVDIYFFYQANQGTFYAGGITDFFYFFSYTFMALALVSMGQAYKHIKAT